MYTIYVLLEIRQSANLSENKIKRIRKPLYLNNFLVGYKFNKTNKSCSNVQDLFHAPVSGIRSRQGLPINWPSALIVMVKRHVAYVSLVLPEVLKNPIAFFNFNKDEKKKSQLQELLLKLNNKPMMHSRTSKKKWAVRKAPQRVKIKTKDLFKDAIKPYNKTNRVIYKI